MAERYVTMGGKGAQSRPLRLGRWRFVALAGIAVWLVVAIGLPLAGVLLRAFVSRWGEGVNPFETLTLQNFRDLAEYPNLVGGIFNTFLLATVGGAAAVALYALVALAAHRWRSPLVAGDRLSRAAAALLAGAGRRPCFPVVFLFVPHLGVLRSSLVGLWLAYTVVWLAFGLRLISATLAQISPQLEEAARVAGARPGRVLADVTLPLIRFGLMSSWLLCFMTFVARIFDRRLPAGARNRGAGPVDRDAVRRRLARARGGAVGGERRPRRRRFGARVAVRGADLAS